MATYYVSTTGSNAAAGTAVGTAWETLAYAASTISAEDIVVVLDGASSHDIGSGVSFAASGNYVRIVGADASGTIGAAKPVLRATSAGSTALTLGANQHVMHLEVDANGNTSTAINLGGASNAGFVTARGATSSGFVMATASAFASLAIDNGDRGFDGGRSQHYCFAIDNVNQGFYNFGRSYDCVAINNGNDGFYCGTSNIAARCSAIGNGDNGFQIANDGAFVVGCLAVSNGAKGFLTGFSTANTRAGTVYACLVGSGSAANTTGGFDVAGCLEAANVTADPEISDIIGTVPTDVDVRPAFGGSAEVASIPIDFSTGSYASLPIGAALPEPAAGGVILPRTRVSGG